VKDSGVNIVWLKRDIRFQDHAPLNEAAKHGPFIVLYVYEPILWNAPEADISHLEFVNEALVELDQKLRSIGGRIVFRWASSLAVLKKLHAQIPIRNLWSHEETGSMATYQRDLAVKRWCRNQGVMMYVPAERSGKKTRESRWLG
jgi:deoxyribodipyrimidine photo-lyase